MNIKEMMEHTLDQMWDEVMGAKHYLELADEYYDECPTLSKVFLELAPIELTHYEKLLKGFEESLVLLKSKDIAVPDEIKVIWNYDKRRLSHKAEIIKWGLSNIGKL